MCLALGKSLSEILHSTLATTFSFDSSSELGFGATSTEKEVVYDLTTDITPERQHTTVATIPTLMVHGYADEQRNRDLIMILLLTSSALLFCLGMGLLFMKYGK